MLEILTDRCKLYPVICACITLFEYECYISVDLLINTYRFFRFNSHTKYSNKITFYCKALFLEPRTQWSVCCPHQTIALQNEKKWKII